MVSSLPSPRVIEFTESLRDIVELQLAVGDAITSERASYPVLNNRRFRDFITILDMFTRQSIGLYVTWPHCLFHCAANKYF